MTDERRQFVRRSHHAWPGSTSRMTASASSNRRVLASTNNHPRRMGSHQPLIEAWNVETGERENFSGLPETPDAPVEGIFLQPIALLPDAPAAAPLLSTQRVIVEGYMGVSADRTLLALGKPIEQHEAGLAPNWSGRLLLWDVEWEQPLGTLVLPSGFWDVAFLPNGRVATLNENGTVLVLRGLSPAD